MRALRNYPELLTVKEARAILRCGRKSIYMYIRQGRLSGELIGNAYLISKASIRNFIRAIGKSDKE